MPATVVTHDLLGWNGSVPNMADGSSEPSCEIAGRLLAELEIDSQRPNPGQTAGTALETAVHDYLAGELTGSHGDRSYEVSRRSIISDFAQYEQLAHLKTLMENDATETLREVIGTDYLIKPDVTVGLRGSAETVAHLHAAVPCKWTLRSDRAQNIRHEAVVMTRHRRGRLPHIVAVTAEPLPSRLASLARGTGEIDAVYHVALDELGDAVQSAGFKEQATILAELVTHRRLRDLSELPETLKL